jgi:hypothetical protein
MIQLGVNKSNLEFVSRYLNLSQRYWSFNFSDFFDSAHLLTVTDVLFLDSA